VENEYSPDSGLPIFNGAVVDVPRRRSYQSPFDVSDQTAVRGRIDWQHQLDERWGFTDKLYLNSLDWESAGTIFNGVFPFPPTFSPALLRTLIALDNDQRFVGNQFEATYSGDAFRLLLGLEAGKQDDDFLIDVGLLPAIDPFQPFETATEPIFFLPQFGQAGETTAEVLAPYAVAQIEVGEWASLLLGARFDAIEFEDRISGQSSSDDELSPMLGLVVGPSGTWSIYANYAESFAPPSARVVGERQPKESDQLELGVKWVLAKGRFSGSAALYQLDLENLAIVDETGFSAQQGSQRSEGFELELVGTPRRGWRYQLGYGYLSAELVAFRELVQIGPLPTDVVVLDRAGNEPAFAPSNTLDAWVVRELQSGLGVGLGARWVDEQFLGEDNAFVIDDAWTLDSFVAFELPAWRFSLNLKNLLDEEAFGRGFGRESVIPTKGFEAIFGVEYRR
jgi:iron complex outermembrane receptor protein